jgi:hypothetical protein
MKNIIKEELLNQAILESVKRHMSEAYAPDPDNEEMSDDQDPQGLLMEYINTSIRFLEKIKKIANHPDANFMLSDDDTAFEQCKGILNNAHGLFNYLKSELGQPKKEKVPPKYDPKKYKEIGMDSTHAPTASQLNEKKR